tara:strand:+ start:3399 stop:3773 length:375 start_codon:yes stop_codon:yes gene_type:complete
MKVRVSYATELDSLTDKLSELIEQNVAPIEQVIALIKSVSCVLKIEGDNSIEYSHEAIDRVRKSLSEIDESLADVSGLMGGYIKNVLKPEPIPTQAPPVSEATKPNTYDYKPKHSVPPHDSESE